jgi:hypothetical protein
MKENWYKQAECRGLSHLFIPEEGVRDRVTQRQAMALCKKCAVRSNCLDLAIREPDWSLGVWAGRARDPLHKLVRQLRNIISLPATAGIPQLLALVQAQPDLHVRGDETFRTAVTGTDQDREILVHRSCLPIITIAALVLLATPSQLDTLVSHCSVPMWMRDAIWIRTSHRFGHRVKVVTSKTKTAA